MWPFKKTESKTTETCKECGALVDRLSVNMRRVDIYDSFVGLSSFRSDYYCKTCAPPYKREVWPSSGPLEYFTDIVWGLQVDRKTGEVQLGSLRGLLDRLPLNDWYRRRLWQALNSDFIIYYPESPMEEVNLCQEQPAPLKKSKPATARRKVPTSSPKKPSASRSPSQSKARKVAGRRSSRS